MSKYRDTRGLARRKAFRRPNKSILIVCEGAETEPNYFGYFKRRLRLANVDVDICGRECGTDPLSVVNYAAERFKYRGIDECFCVIDRDKHDQSNFLDAVQKAAALGKKSSPKRVFEIYVSDPCVEYWFLLHFLYDRSPYVASGGRSRGENSVAELKKHWPQYDKSDIDIGHFLYDRLPDAIKNAERALDDVAKTKEANPSTALHKLVQRLMSAS